MSTPGLAPPPINDDDAWVPVSAVWLDRFPTYKRFLTFIEKTPQIKTRKPSKQRFELHSGDWARNWKEHDNEAFEGLADDSAKIEALLESASRRRATLRGKKSRK